MPSKNPRGRSATVARSGPASTKLTALTLATYGHACWLKLPGCAGRATTKDHVIPVAQGGTDAIENLRPACASCNSTRRDMAIAGTLGGILVTVYIGPLVDRCTSEAQAEALHGVDPVIAPGPILDAITRTGIPSPAQRRVADRAYRAAVDQALKMREPCHVRIAHPTPTPKLLQTWDRLRYFVRVIDPGRSVAEQEATIGGRESIQEVARWYDLYPEGQASVDRVRTRTPTATPANVNAPAAAEPSRAW